MNIHQRQFQFQFRCFDKQNGFSCVLVMFDGKGPSGTVYSHAQTHKRNLKMSNRLNCYSTTPHKHMHERYVGELSKFGYASVCGKSLSEWVSERTIEKERERASTLTHMAPRSSGGEFYSLCLCVCVRTYLNCFKCVYVYKNSTPTLADDCLSELCVCVFVVRHFMCVAS